MTDATAARLRAAEVQAEQLFAAIEAAEIVAPGVSESEASRRIHELAGEMFGGPVWWHRRVVRAGANTLCPYYDHPPDLVLGDDDIAFVDLGPVFDGWEADFGKTYVLGDDPDKLRLSRDVVTAFRRGRAYFEQQSDCTGTQLFAFMDRTARELGWQLGSEMSGHLIGSFPHAKIPGEKVHNYIHPENPAPLRGHYPDGTPRHWILEAHLVDRERGFGGFFEALLTA
jgi:Xaa-Pro dipeptidase